MKLRFLPLTVFALVCCSLLAALSETRAQNPGYAKDPVIIEYDVDPDWPARPDDIAAEGWVSGLAIDDKDQVWFFRKGKDPVQVYTSDGKFVRSWGNEQNFVYPHHLRIGPDGNVWLSDFGRHVVMKFTPEGKLLQTLGVLDEKGDDDAHFDRPTDMAITPEGEVFITDGYGNNRRIVHYGADGKFVKTWGEYGSTPGKFVLPHSIVVDSKGKLYVADRNSGRIQVFDQEGKFLDEWKNIIMPWGLSITKDDELWVCGSSPHWWLRHGVYPEYKDQVFMRFSTDGRVQQVWQIPLGDIGPDKNKPDTSKLKPGEAVGVHCIAADSKGNLFVGEIYSERAEKFVPITKRPADEKKAKKDGPL